jgi:hypothetical protein
MIETKKDIQKLRDTPGTPALYNTGKEDLLRVVCDVRAKAIDDTAVVTVSEESDLRRSHALPQRLEDECQRSVKQIAAEGTKLCRPLVFAIS